MVLKKSHFSKVAHAHAGYLEPAFRNFVISN